MEAALPCVYRCFKYWKAHLCLRPWEFIRSSHHGDYPFTIIIIISTILPTFPNSVDVRRGEATESEWQAIRIVRDLHNP